ncbi:ankyrin repeat domain-containing protein [Micavibrio aeruginosavorus]|uniref:ankyrin repeat domain-containing protein n=1 Tax=Micavibrio aeruginosavorus TaxID=349221 RepID=UPI003F4AF25B
MASAKKLTRLAAAAGLGFVTLLGAFNAAAISPINDNLDRPQTPDAVATPLQSPPASVVIDPLYQLNSDLTAELRALGRLIEERGTTPDYDPRRDESLRINIDTIKSMLDQGANPNFRIEKGMRVGKGTVSSPFMASIQLSSMLMSTELLAHFLTKNADLYAIDADGWTIMDYAISNLQDAQTQSREKIDLALHIVRILEGKGLTLNDTRETLKTAKQRDYAATAKNLFGMHVLHEHGLVSDEAYNQTLKGTDAARDALLNAPDITASMLRDHGLLTPLYEESRPAGSFSATVAMDDTLDIMAARFYRVMGAMDQVHARALIAHANAIPFTGTEAEAHKILPLGDELKIPLPVGREIGVISVYSDGATFKLLAEGNLKTYYRIGAPIESIAAELSALNGLPLDTKLKSKQKVLFPYINDSHTHVKRIAPAPSAARNPVDLFIVEGNPLPIKVEDSHHRDTYRVATGTTYGINPAANLDRIHAIESLPIDYPSPQIPDGLRALFSANTGHDAPDSPNNQFVFSHSMGSARTEKQADDARQSRSANDLTLESIGMMLDPLNQAKPIVFSAAGNYWYGFGSGRYMQSYTLTHSPRAVLIGASAISATKNTAPNVKIHVMTHYSSYGADVCARVPNFRGELMTGTSFSTPSAAAQYRQLAEWYGDRLSFEEIMAAGLMSADRDVLDVENIGKYHPVHAPKLNTLNSVPALYTTNGGGLPHHERCGAGVLDPQSWHDTLQKTLSLKEKFNLSAKLLPHQTVHINAFGAQKNAEGKTEYTYSIAAPADMTLGKLTFLLPQHQNKHSEVVVRTPAGFEMQMPKAYTDALSTFAFAYEDVKQGDVFEIRTTEPLGPKAGIVFNGHAPGNSIAGLRDYLRGTGTLPAPLKSMQMNKVTGPAAPVDIHKPLPAAPGPQDAFFPSL